MTDTQHHLIVTTDPDDPERFDYDIDCPGVTDACRLWLDCVAGEAESEALNAVADNGEPPIAHGKLHRMIAGTWMAKTDQCYVQGHDRLPDAVDGQFEPGRHAVDWDSGDGTELEVFAIDKQEHADD